MPTNHNYPESRDILFPKASYPMACFHASAIRYVYLCYIYVSSPPRRISYMEVKGLFRAQFLTAIKTYNDISRLIAQQDTILLEKSLIHS